MVRLLLQFQVMFQVNKLRVHSSAKGQLLFFRLTDAHSPLAPLLINDNKQPMRELNSQILTKVKA